jgi:prevent-host-death family protein
MKTVNLYEAKTRLSRLVEEAAKGEEIIIAEAGRPLARLVPMGRSGKPRKPGAWKGRVVIAADFECSSAGKSACRFPIRAQMRLLLDTRVFQWWLADERLKSAERAAIRDPENYPRAAFLPG